MIASRRDWADLIRNETKDKVLGLIKGGLGPIPAVRLETSRLFMRAPRPRDWRAWSTLREENRDFLTPWEPTWPTDAYSKRAFMRRLRRQLADWRTDRGFHLFIFTKETRQLMGGVGLSSVRRGVAQMASLGYWAGQAFCRQGLMTEAVRAMIGYGFRHGGLHRVEAACLPHNEASHRLLLRVGFNEEGYAKNYLRIDGAWRDHLLFGLSREEYDAAHPAEAPAR